MHTEYPKGYEQNERMVRGHEKQEALRKDIKTSTHRFTLSLAGANPNPVIRKEEPNTYTENFYLAHCPNGITGVHTYNRVVMEEVYPGIDWIVYSNGGNGLKYDFLLKPGADPSLIKLKVSDADAVSITSDGELLMKTSLGEVKEDAPTSFASGKKIETHFIQGKDGTIGFALAGYDKTKELVIDPTVSWATYYGGSEYEIGFGCAVDKIGDVYMVGETGSTSGIASGGFQNTSGQHGDAFLVKFNSAGARLWSTYYGGDSSDAGHHCAVDKNNNVYLAGQTASSSGIASGGFRNTFSGVGQATQDAFLVKFTTQGIRIWATYYGGSKFEDRSVCAVDDSDHVYLTGYTSSDTGIAYQGFQNTIGGTTGSRPYDGYMVKFDGNGNRIWATYYGGSDEDIINYCSLDSRGNIYIAGCTYSPTGIAAGGFQNTEAGDLDGFLAKFSASGNRIWGSYYGGPFFDGATSCIADKHGKVYLTGFTYSTTGIASGGFRNAIAGTSDAFLVQFDTSGNRIWGTYYGGTFGYDNGTACGVDDSGNVYLAGYTSEFDTGIAFGGFQNTYGGDTADYTSDAFMVKFNSNGVRHWGSYYGGDNNDNAGECIVQGNGIIYMTGYTSSPANIASGGFQNSLNGSSDAFLVKINDTLNSSPNAVNTPTNPTTLTLYPNPNHGTFTLSIQNYPAKANEPLHLDVVDMMGRTVWREEVKTGAGNWSLPVKLGNVAVGMYLLRLSSAQQTAVQRFEVVQ